MTDQTAAVRQTPDIPQAAVLPAPQGAEQSFSLDRLTAEDRRALTQHICDTTGWACADLTAAMSVATLTPEDLWMSLRGTTDVRLMIAAAALRSVTRCPPDPQLSPQPHRLAPVRSPRTPAEAARRARPAPAAGAPGTTGEYVDTVAPNPKRPGSASRDRYALYAVGASRTDLLAAGLTRADFVYDTERGYVTWRATAEAAQAEQKEDSQ